MSRPARLLVLLACLGLGACLGPRSVVVEPSEGSAPRTSRPAPDRNARGYTVVRGDTLYGIAFRHGVDFRELARINRIASPYTIYPGQRLVLAPGSAANPARPVTRPVESRTPATPAPGSITGMPVPPATTPPPTPSTPARTPTPAPSSPTSAAPAAPGATQRAEGVVWRWPASGQLIGRFVAGDPTRQGINIAGSAGQPVFAAAAGEVVYSGAGLIGYGELVIIKHNDVFLSAYGHNRKRLVAEGQRVTAGQQIAEMGRTGAARDMLHFEIRRSGKPVDPLPLLPKK
jgi:lipoprotein NlpD